MYITEMLYSEANNTNTRVMLFFFSEPNKDSDYSINQSHILHIVFDFPPQTFPLIIGLKNIELNKYNFPKHKTSFTN